MTGLYQTKIKDKNFSTLKYKMVIITSKAQSLNFSKQQSQRR
jgi:hypothetical protein